jgi:hypothetical protein
VGFLCCIAIQNAALQQSHVDDPMKVARMSVAAFAKASAAALTLARRSFSGDGRHAGSHPERAKPRMSLRFAHPGYDLRLTRKLFHYQYSQLKVVFFRNDAKFANEISGKFWPRQRFPSALGRVRKIR